MPNKKQKSFKQDYDYVHYEIEDLHNSIVTNDQEKVRKILDWDPVLANESISAIERFPNKLFDTPLSVAASLGFIEICKIILEYEGDLYNYCPGIYPLQAASSKGFIDVVVLLLENGADPNHFCNKMKANNAVLETNSLISACEGGHLDVAIKLMEWGADPNEKTQQNGKCALNSAIKSGNKDIVRALLEAGADPNWKINTPPISIAILQENNECVHFLLEFGADPNMEDLMGYSPMYYATAKVNEDALNMLWKYGAEVGGREGELAFKKNRWDILERLCRWGFHSDYEI